MEYHLRFSINYDELHWNRDTYQKDKQKVYTDIIKEMKLRDTKIEDWYIEFRNGTPELAIDISKHCKRLGYNFDLWVFPWYSKQDIATARYVPFGTKSEPVDMDDDGNDLNEYKEVLCTTCWNTNNNNVPNPYLIYSKRVKKPRDLFDAMNGVNIVSILAFELLRNEIEPWIDFGKVQIVNEQKKPVESSYEYVWVRPKFQVGRFVNAKVKQICNKCGRSTEIRMERSADIFEANKWVIESFENAKAPIVLAGNWFGEIGPKTTSNQSRYVFISGELHEKIRKLKLKGFIKADYVIHTADEPYDWDPLKDRNPAEVITYDGI